MAQFAKKNLFELLGMSNTFIMEDPTRKREMSAITGKTKATGDSGLYPWVEDRYRWNQNFHENRSPWGEHMKEFVADGTFLALPFTHRPLGS